jgi:hypothetical protein
MTALLSRSEVLHAFGEGMPCHGVGLGGEMGVDGGRGGRLMPQVILDETQVDAGLEQMGGIAVSQGVHRGARMDATLREGPPERILYTGAWHGGGCCGHADTATARSGEEPERVAVGVPILAPAFQGAWCQGDITVLGAFTAAHMDEHTGRVDIRNVQVGALLQA